MEASKILAPEYAGTLKKVSKRRKIEIKHLSEAMCRQIASYYRLALQRNRRNIDSIIKAVEAIPYHLGVNHSYAEEYHPFCPFEQHSWCQYQSAKYINKPLPQHPNYPSEEAVNIIIDV